VPTLHPVIELLRGLNRADASLQIAFRELLQRYFQFLNSTPRAVFKTTRWLRMRFERDSEGRIRSVSWTIRMRAKRAEGSLVKGCTRRLVGGFTRDCVYNIAKDWSRVGVYEAFDRERRTLNALLSQTLDNLRRLRLSFANRWAHRAGAEDRVEVERLVATHAPHLKVRDVRPLAGVLAYQRELDRAAAELGRAVTDWRARFGRSIWVDFEPALRPNGDGSLRLYWGFPQRVDTREGARTFTQYIPGRPTDLFMRERRMPRHARKEVGAFMKRILPLERRYRELVGQVGRHRKRIHELLSRVARVGGPSAPAEASAELRRAGEGDPVKEVPCESAGNL
jgi:hypothetical protein